MLMAYNNHRYPQVPPQSQVVINHRYQASVHILLQASKANFYLT